jgi:hypothetical protein
VRCPEFNPYCCKTKQNKTKQNQTKPKRQKKKKKKKNKNNNKPTKSNKKHIFTLGSWTPWGRRADSGGER